VVFAYVNFSDLQFDDLFFGHQLGGRKIYEFAPIPPENKKWVHVFWSKNLRSGPNIGVFTPKIDFFQILAKI
jgi:hypothetical protein